MRACAKFCHPLKLMARPALQWPPVTGYGTAVTQFSQRSLATTPNNHLSPAHSMEDARNVLSHEMSSEATNPSPCAIFGWQLMYFHYVTANRQLFTWHLMKPPSSPRTIHSGSNCHTLIYFFQSRPIFYISFIKGSLNIWSAGSPHLDLRRLMHVAAVYPQTTTLDTFTKGSQGFQNFPVKNTRTYVASSLELW